MTDWWIDETPPRQGDRERPYTFYDSKSFADFSEAFYEAAKFFKKHGITAHESYEPPRNNSYPIGTEIMRSKAERSYPTSEQITKTRRTRRR